MQRRQNFLDQLKLFISHSLDNESLIMTKEEKAATRSSCFACLEDLVTVGFRIKRLLDLEEVDIVHCSHSLEDTGRVGNDLGTR